MFDLSPQLRLRRRRRNNRCYPPSASFVLSLLASIQLNTKCVCARINPGNVRRVGLKNRILCLENVQQKCQSIDRHVLREKKIEPAQIKFRE